MTIEAQAPSMTAGKPWTTEPQDPDYEACGRTLLTLARKYARKFYRGTVESIHGTPVEDLAMLGAVHVLVQAKRGRLDRVPSEERWHFIRRLLWNRMVDESRLFRNRNELQPPTFSEDVDGTEMDGHGALEIMGAHISIDVPTREVAMLSTILDTALHTLPDPEAMLMKLRFGLLRNDELGERRVSYLDPCTLDDLAKIGYGKDRFAVKARINRGLSLLRGFILGDLRTRAVGSFTA